MANYLTTEELVKLIDQKKSITPLASIRKPVHNKIRKKFKINKRTIFFMALILAIIHIFYISVPLLSEDRGINTYKSTTILAVPMNQVFDGQLAAKVVRIKKVDLETIAVGDEIVLYGRYNTELYWIEEIVSIDYDLGIAETTFDGVISNTVNLEDFKGVYIEDANLLGIISYISSNLKGYIFMLGTYFILFSTVYIFYIRKKEDKPVY